MWQDILAGVSLVGSGIQAGALLMVLYGVCPTFRQLSIPEWMRLHVSLDRSVERYMPALNLVTGGTTLILLFLPQEPEIRLLRVVALLHNIALALMSEMVNVRLNKLIAGQLPRLVGVGAGGATAGAITLPPAENTAMAAVRDRWIGWHRWRTLVITVGFVEYAIAALLSG